MSEPTVSEIVATMDSQVAALQGEHEHLVRTADGIAKEMAALEARMRELLVAKSIALSMSQMLRNRSRSETEPETATTSKPTIADAAAAVLREYGGEMNMAELVWRLSMRGVLRGKEKRATLSTQLIRNKDRFRRVGPGRWALGSELESPAGSPQPEHPWRRLITARQSAVSAIPTPLMPNGPSEPTDEELDDVLQREPTREDDNPDGEERVGGPSHSRDPLDDDPF